MGIYLLGQFRTAGFLTFGYFPWISLTTNCQRSTIRKQFTHNELPKLFWMKLKIIKRFSTYLLAVMVVVLLLFVEAADSGSDATVVVVVVVAVVMIVVVIVVVVAGVADVVVVVDVIVVVIAVAFIVWLASVFLSLGWLIESDSGICGLLEWRMLVKPPPANEPFGESLVTTTDGARTRARGLKMAGISLLSRVIPLERNERFWECSTWIQIGISAHYHLHIRMPGSFYFLLQIQAVYNNIRHHILFTSTVCWQLLMKQTTCKRNSSCFFFVWVLFINNNMYSISVISFCTHWIHDFHITSILIDSHINECI